MKNESVSKILRLILSLQIALAPSLVRADNAAPATSPTAVADAEPIPPAMREGNDLWVPTEKDKFGIGVDGVKVQLGTPEQVAQNRPSIMAKKTIGDRAFHFTSQYVYFQMVMGLSALATLAMNYENDPIALQNFIKSYTSWDHFGESLFSFGAFLWGDAKVTHLLKQHLKLNGPGSALLVQQIGMGAGLVLSTVVGELWNDKNIRLCAASRGTDLDHCDAAFDTWVKTDRIVQYIPMIIQNTGAALISAGITKVIQKSIAGVAAGLDKVTGKTEVDKMVAAIKKGTKPKIRDRVYAWISNFGIGKKTSTEIAKRGFMFLDGLPGGIIGLSLFMVVDATVASPAMKAYTKNYIAEQRSWIRRLKDNVSTASFYPLTWTSYWLYAGLSSAFPDYFPKFTDEKSKERWMREFDLDTFTKFYRLWAKYNIAARKESGEVSLINMFSWQPISKTMRESKIVDYPQDGFEIIRDAHEALLTSLDYSKKDLWQTYNVNHCSASLSAAAQLSFQQAMQFYIGLTKEEKQCIVDINIYDNLVSFIERNTKHRNFLLSPLTTATSAWMEALSKFTDMAKISFFTYRTLVKSQLAASKNQTTYPSPRGPINAIPLTYEGVLSVVKENEKESNHEVECNKADPGYYACMAIGEERDSNFLPSPWGSNSGIGQVAIKNNTDYIIAQMACGPDVKDTSAFYNGLSAQTYETFIGKMGRVISMGLDTAYRHIPGLGYDEFKVFHGKMKDPNSAMIYTPVGLYPRFVPPRIVTGKGDICMNRITGDNSVATGIFAEGGKEYKGLLPYVVSHIKPEILINPKNPDAVNFRDWYLENIQVPLDAGYDAFQGVFGRILKQELAPVLLRDKFTDGCKNGQNCFQSWKHHKVSLGVYQSMMIEIRVLLGLLNEIYVYPSEMMAKARTLDDKNPLATSVILYNELKEQMSPEQLSQLDTRQTIFFNEATDTTVQKKSANPMAGPSMPKLLSKLDQTMPANFEQLKALEVEFTRSFRANDADMSTDKNGLVSFNVEQSEKALRSLQMFFTLSRLNEINDLQAKVSGLIFRALESLLQERYSYNNFLKVEEIVERKLDQPEPTRRTGMDKLTKAFVKPSSKEADAAGDRH